MFGILFSLFFPFPDSTFAAVVTSSNGLSSISSPASQVNDACMSATTSTTASTNQEQIETLRVKDNVKIKGDGRFAT